MTICISINLQRISFSSFLWYYVSFYLFLFLICLTLHLLKLSSLSYYFYSQMCAYIKIKLMGKNSRDNLLLRFSFLHKNVDKCGYNVELYISFQRTSFNSHWTIDKKHRVSSIINFLILHWGKSYFVEMQKNWTLLLY